MLTQDERNLIAEALSGDDAEALVLEYLGRFTKPSKRQKKDVDNFFQDELRPLLQEHAEEWT